MSDDVRHHARSFGGVADSYDRGRPTYGDDAARWLTGPDPLTVLELGAGTGKLTARLVALGHDVHATDPDRVMLDLLQQNLPGVRTSVASAEELPSADSSYDVVVAAQCFHWFDAAAALPEILRVLKPGGRFSAVWNLRDEKIPWVRKLGRIIGTQETLESAGPLVESDLFVDVEEETFTQWQLVDRRSILDLVASRSNIAVLGDEERASLLAEVLDLYDDYGRGMDGMQLPYRTVCYRSAAVIAAVPDTPARGNELEPTVPIATSRQGREHTDGELPRVVAEQDDDAVTLIDFR